MSVATYGDRRVISEKRNLGVDAWLPIVLAVFVGCGPGAVRNVPADTVANMSVGTGADISDTSESTGPSTHESTMSTTEDSGGPVDTCDRNRGCGCSPDCETGCQEGMCEPPAFTTQYTRGLAIDGGILWYGARPSTSYVGCEIHMANLDTFATRFVADDSESSCWHLAVHEGNVYWFRSEGELVRMPFGGGSVETVSGALGYGHWHGFAQASEFVFIIQNGDPKPPIFELALETGVTRTIVESGARALAIGEGRVFWAHDDRKIRSLSGKTVRLEAGSAYDIDQLIVRTTGVVWVSKTGERSWTMFEQPATGGLRSLAVEPKWIISLATDGNDVAWATQDHISIVDVNGEITVLAVLRHPVPLIHALVLTQDAVYWSSQVGVFGARRP